jgi:hydroxymethylbilane synthase
VSAVPGTQDREAGIHPLLPARLRIGTRRSALATTQTRWLATLLQERLAGYGIPIELELVEVTSHGDVSTAPLSSLGGTGVFVTALREALLDGRIDVAVHSLKDMPTAPAKGLHVAAIPAREDPRDALVARDGLTLTTLPPGARIGTGSPRRAAQLRALGTDLEVVDIRGNVDTRVRMVTDGTLDAVVLAYAGLLRLGRGAEVTQVLDVDLMLPAPGQGALAAETRADDLPTQVALSCIEDIVTRVCVTAERSLLAQLEAGCAAPVGALATAVLTPGGDLDLRLDAAVGALDGSVMLRRSGSATIDTSSCPDVRASMDAPTAEALGVGSSTLGMELADHLLAVGAADLMPGSTPGNTPGGAARSRNDVATDLLPVGSSGRADSSAPAREGEP